MILTEKKLIRFIQENKIFLSEDRVLLALSGGPDSVYLLLFLLKNKNIWKLDISAAHFNHMLRSAADEDEEFCRSLCCKLDVPFFSTQKDVAKYAVQNNKSIEEAARILRYEYLDKLAVEHNFGKIITAHNKNDNTETVLFNLFKGTGFRGVTGIPIVRGNIVRPMLCLTKEEILESLSRNNASYKIDETNMLDNYDRNYIRHNIIPLVEQRLNPDLHESLFRFSKNIQQLADMMLQNLPEIINSYVSQQNSNRAISCDLVEYNSDLIVSEVLKSVLRECGLSRIESSTINRLINLFTQNTGTVIELKNNYVAIKNRNEIIITNNNYDIEYEYKITPGNEVFINELGIKIKIEKIIDGNVNFSDEYEIISAHNTNDIFILRNWIAGDKFIPLGMKGEKKISDFLTDEKIPANQKKQYPVLLNRNNIVYVVGLRIDNRYKFNKENNELYKIWISK